MRDESKEDESQKTDSQNIETLKEDYKDYDLLFKVIVIGNASI